jgi:hypothetical protein
MPTVKALLIAPMVGLLIAAVMVLPWIGEVHALALYLFLGASYIYATALLVGLPLYLVMKRRIRSPRLWHYAVGGIVSSLPMVYLILGVEGADHPHRWLQNTVLCLATGLNSGVVFGILIRHFEKREESVRAL